MWVNAGIAVQRGRFQGRRWRRRGHSCNRYFFFLLPCSGAIKADSANYPTPCLCLPACLCSESLGVELPQDPKAAGSRQKKTRWSVLGVPVLDSLSKVEKFWDNARQQRRVLTSPHSLTLAVCGITTIQSPHHSQDEVEEDFEVPQSAERGKQFPIYHTLIQPCRASLNLHRDCSLLSPFSCKDHKLT